MRTRDREAPPVSVRPHDDHYPRNPKFLLYSHDTFGLGNIRRTLLLSETLKSEYPGASVLIVTGSPVIHSFRLPEGVDYIKLPCLDRVAAEKYEPLLLAACSPEVKRTRVSLLKNCVLGFDPDLMIVDKRPSGVDGELLDTLALLHRRGRRTRLVLGLRDILDAPEVTRRRFGETRAFETIDKYYDEVWIYGLREMFDAVAEYGFPRAIADRTHYCGYLKRTTRDGVPRLGPPRVLVTTGGSADGNTVIETYLEGLARQPRSLPLLSTIVFGPNFPLEQRQSVLDRFGFLADVTFLDFQANMAERYSEADVIVSMAGYNAVCELLSFRSRAVLVPRSEPVTEQLIRSRLFAERGYFDAIEPKALTPDLLLERVLAALERDRNQFPAIDLDGLPRVRMRTRALLQGVRA